MNRQLTMPEILKEELISLEYGLTGTERIMIRRKMAKIVIIDRQAYFIDMVMVENKY